MRHLTQLLGSTAFALILSLSISARADVVQFSGADAGAGPVAGQNNRPNSDLAASQFAVAAANAVPFGFVNTVNFENIPLSTPNVAITNQVIVPGQMTLTLTGTSLSSGGSAIYGISDTPNDVSTGYNTTVGGTKHLKIAPQINVGTATVRFDFSQAINSFGMYLTGLGTSVGSLTLDFNDGTPVSLPITGSATGGVQYFGFTDINKSIQSVVLTISGVNGPDRDVFGIDDIRYAVVPEPSSFVLIGVGLGCLGLIKRRQSRARSIAAA